MGDAPNTRWANRLRAGTDVVNGKVGEHGSPAGVQEQGAAQRGVRWVRGGPWGGPPLRSISCGGSVVGVSEQRQTEALGAGLGRGSWLRRAWELGFWPGFGEMPPLKGSAFGRGRVASPCSAGDKGHRRHHPLLLHLGPESVRGDVSGWGKSSRA